MQLTQGCVFVHVMHVALHALVHKALHQTLVLLLPDICDIALSVIFTAMITDSSRHHCVLAGTCCHCSLLTNSFPACSGWAVCR